jgi:hypothetical protein
VILVFFFFEKCNTWLIKQEQGCYLFPMNSCFLASPFHETYVFHHNNYHMNALRFIYLDMLGYVMSYNVNISILCMSLVLCVCH